jgi:hypothetical protein
MVLPRDEVESTSGFLNNVAKISLSIWKRLLIVLTIPVTLSVYFRPSTGNDFRVGFFKKLALIFKMARNRRKVVTGSHYLEHLVMATQILGTPRSLEGCVVECGSFKGGSAANLSLVCALCDRQLEIFDSFEGLPEPSDVDKEHVLMSVREVHTYSQGAWRGSLPEVKRNISKHGEIGSCHFNVGYLAQTLPSFQKKCVLLFLDVDLVDSLKTCLKYLWPLLQDGCYLFTHEAQHTEIPALFFDEEWWRSNLGCKAPGFVGSGTGLGLLPASSGFQSDLGFTIKNPGVLNFKTNPQTGRFRDD